MIKAILGILVILAIVFVLALAGVFGHGTMYDAQSHLRWMMRHIKEAINIVQEEMPPTIVTPAQGDFYNVIEKDCQ